MKKVLSSILLAAGLALGASFAHAEANPGVQGLNDLLIQKGIITKEEVETQAQKHSLNITGYIQVQGKVIQNEDASPNDGFTIRRAKLAAYGVAYEHVKFKLEVDFVGESVTTSTSTTPQTTTRMPRLDDAFIEDDHLPYLIGKVGQFKVPFSLEMLTSDTEILTIERSEVANMIAPERDLGLSFSGNVLGGMLNYSIGIFNGQASYSRKPYNASVGSYTDAGRNKANDNDQMMSAGRMVLKPFKWASIGVSGLASRDGNGSTAIDHNAFGAELQVENPECGCSLQGEYLRQWQKNVSDSTTTSDGFYVQIGHYLVPKNLEAVVKYEEYDSNKDVANSDDIRWTTVGVNFYIYGNDAKLMADYIFKDEKQQDKNNNTFLTQLQLRF